MEDEKFIDELVAKYLSGNATPSEVRELFSWMDADSDNKMFFDNMVQLWGAAKEETLEFDVDLAWDELEGKLTANEKIADLNTYEPAKIIPMTGRRKWWAAAAAVLVLFSAGYYWSANFLMEKPTSIAITTGPSERKMHVFPDGSKVWLNQNTTISYAAAFSPRSLKMSGEAFFEVEKDPDHPFTIEAGATETKVLGTSFTVRAYPDEEIVEVTVAIGKVEVKSKKQEAKQILLDAGKSGFYDEAIDTLAIAEKVFLNAQAWKEEQLEFDETKLIDVIEALERYFEIEIESKQLNALNCTINGSYKKPKVEDILNLAAITLNFEVRKLDENHFQLTGGSKCN